MYKFADKQISIDEFQQPLGMKLKTDNRWVKKAMLIPWEEIERRYAKLFTNKKGNVAKPLRLALGACLIQAEYGYSDEETAFQIQEAAYLQYFCGYKSYDDSKLPFDPSLMVYFRKRLTPEILGEINEIVIAKQSQLEKDENKDNKDDNSDNGSNSNDDKCSNDKNKSKDDSDTDNKENNSGIMIVDATCAPSQIKYPQDTALLNQARKITEKLIDELHIIGEVKPRTYRKQAHKDYLFIAKNRKPGKKKIRKAIGKQLRYLKRNIENLEKMQTTKLSKSQALQLETIKKLYQQQKYMYDNHCHSVENRIVSLNQPYLRPIVRGKAKASVEFGAKLDISVCDGWTRLEVSSFDAYNESTTLQETIERYKTRNGNYPKRVLADKIYRTRDNLQYCKKYGISLSGPALGRPKKDEQPDKEQNYKDECQRIEVERCFSLAKRKCGLGLITAKLEETAKHSIAISILVLNLRKIQCALKQEHIFCHAWLMNFSHFQKMAFLQ